MYQDMNESFFKAGFDLDELKIIFNILAAILHLGCVDYDDSQFDENS